MEKQNWINCSTKHPLLIWWFRIFLRLKTHVLRVSNCMLYIWPLQGTLQLRVTRHVFIFCYQESTKQYYNSTKQMFLTRHLLFWFKKYLKERPNRNMFNYLLLAQQNQMNTDMSNKICLTTSLWSVWSKITSHYKQIV